MAAKLLAIGKTSKMAGIKLKNVERFKDRHGKTRYYYREGKGPRSALKGVPGSERFLEGYRLAHSVYHTNNCNEEARTFNALAKIYYQSSKFKKQKRSSQKQTRYIIDAFCREHGHRSVAGLTPVGADKLFTQKIETPGAANAFLVKLRVLIKLAIRLQWITFNPTLDLEPFEIGTHHTWTEEEITKYQSYWPIGTLERTTFDLHLYTGQRVSDVCKMFWSDTKLQLDEVISDNGFKLIPSPRSTINVTQLKGGSKLVIPMHANLQRSLALWPRSSIAIIFVTEKEHKGKPYTAKGLGNVMARSISKAGLPDRCVLHGLRKAAARRLAEAGCTPHQIAAITGHKSLREVERYTKAVNQELLAGQAMESLGKMEIA